MHALERLAETERLSELYADSETHFEAACELCPRYALPHYGLARVLLARARLLSSQGQLGAAATLLQRGVTSAQIAVETTKASGEGSVSACKLLGDLRVAAATLSVRALSGSGSTLMRFVAEAKQAYDSAQRLQKRNCFFQHLRAYQTAQAQRWYDLGVLELALHSISATVKPPTPATADATTSSSALLGTCEAAAKCFLEAVKLAPVDPRGWNALGVADPRPHIRQHCFIRALQVAMMFAVGKMGFALANINVIGIALSLSTRTCTPSTYSIASVCCLLVSAVRRVSGRGCHLDQLGTALSCSWEGFALSLSLSLSLCTF